MSHAEVLSSPPPAEAFPPARITRPDEQPWIPISEGFTLRPLRFLSGRGYVALLRLEPGTVIPLHRHTGEIHAWNLQGSRELVTGEVIGPGEYVYEPAGNTDTWRAVGEDVLVVLTIVGGEIDYLGPDGQVLRRTSAATVEAQYRACCAERGLVPADLAD